MFRVSQVQERRSSLSLPFQKKKETLTHAHDDDDDDDDFIVEFLLPPSWRATSGRVPLLEREDHCSKNKGVFVVVLDWRRRRRRRRTIGGREEEAAER